MTLSKSQTEPDSLSPTAASPWLWYSIKSAFFAKSASWILSKAKNNGWKTLLSTLQFFNFHLNFTLPLYGLQGDHSFKVCQELRLSICAFMWPARCPSDAGMATSWSCRICFCGLLWAEVIIKHANFSKMILSYVKTYVHKYQRCFCFLLLRHESPTTWTRRNRP